MSGVGVAKGVGMNGLVDSGVKCEKFEYRAGAGCRLRLAAERAEYGSAAWNSAQRCGIGRPIGWTVDRTGFAVFAVDELFGCSG